VRTARLIPFCDSSSDRRTGPGSSQASHASVI